MNVDVLMLDIYLGFNGKHYHFLVNLYNLMNFLTNAFSRVFLRDTERMLVTDPKLQGLIKYYFRN